MTLFTDSELNVYVQPAASDRGLSIGSACEVSKSLGKPPQPISHMYLGNSYSDNIIEDCLQRSGLAFKHFSNISKKAADLIIDGFVIGWFQGRSEYGSCALGARSILASASIPGNREK